MGFVCSFYHILSYNLSLHKFDVVIEKSIIIHLVHLCCRLFSYQPNGRCWFQNFIYFSLLINSVFKSHVPYNDLVHKLHESWQQQNMNIP